ncbi:MAG: tryptophan--tRNA ligase [Candidatus Saccharimonadales bacterium]
MTKPVILTGLRANQNLTIGNYFGAILPIIDMAKKRSDEYQINMFIPDLHSFTTPVDHSILNKQIFDNARIYVAAGLPLNNENIYLYRQSYIPAHSELTVILNCFTGFGEMSRMTQFKEKRSSIGEDRTSVGLFGYPVLMASDILLYNAKYVPVGDDQTQHLEFTRDIAERMNKKFQQDLFVVPEPVAKQHEFFGKDQGLRIKDLIDPTKKMSKSDESGRGVIFLNDNPEIAYKKVMSATTDNKAEIHFDRDNQPGISNLLEILSLLQGLTLQKIIDTYEGKTKYSDFKVVVAEEVKQFLTNFQIALSNVDDNDAILAKLIQSEQDLTPIANTTLLRVQQAVGLRLKDK